MQWSTVARWAAVSLSLGSTLAIPTAGRADNLVPYEAGEWRYRQVPVDDPLGTVFFAPDFDDSAFLTGQAAFGTMPTCPLSPTVHTTWDPASEMLCRRWFVADPDAPVTVYLAVDNDARVYVNGVLVLDAVHEQCPALDDWSALVPPGVVTSGPNLLAVRAIDRGGECFADLRLVGEPPASAAIPGGAVEPSTWGQVKLAR